MQTPLFSKISKLCRQIEKQEKIKILFAVENGSRAWRLDSKDSDYDVRFVFARPLKEYFTLKPKKDVIDKYFNKNCKPCPVNETFIDAVGFDILKFARLLSKSNPTTIEWLISDIVYYGKQNIAFKKFALKSFNPTTLIYHYQSLCKQNYLKYIKSGELVSYKKYLYAFRGLINASYVEIFQKIPPINFNKALEAKNILPLEIKHKLNEIIKLKKQGKEKELINNIPKFDEYIENFLKKPVTKQEPSEKQTKTLEKEILKVLKVQ